jgi:hypothetical protein
MKRSDKQLAIATAARTLAKNLKTNNSKIEIQDTGSAFVNGEPQNTIGFLLQQAGVPTPKKSSSGVQTALAQALDLDSPDYLPPEIKQAVQAVRDAELNRDYPYQRRRAVVTPLLKLADALTSTKIRKPYVFSGLYTQAARNAGTFGVQAA